MNRWRREQIEYAFAYSMAVACLLLFVGRLWPPRSLPDLFGRVSRFVIRRTKITKLANTEEDDVIRNSRNILILHSKGKSREEYEHKVPIDLKMSSMTSYRKSGIDKPLAIIDI